MRFRQTALAATCASGATLCTTSLSASPSRRSTSPIYAIRNLIYNIDAGNNSYPGISFKFNSGYDQSGRMYLFHNTVDAVRPDNSGFSIKSPGTWQMIISRNNIWTGTNYAIDNANTSQPLDFDYDNPLHDGS